MRIVLHDDESMEPITVLEIERWAYDRLRNGDHVRFAVWADLATDAFVDGHSLMTEPAGHIVDIWFEEFHRKDVKHFFAFTRDSENGMRLRAVFLPGQYGEVQKRQREAFVKGFATALRSL